MCVGVCYVCGCECVMCLHVCVQAWVCVMCVDVSVLCVYMWVLCVCYVFTCVCASMSVCVMCVGVSVLCVRSMVLQLRCYAIRLCMPLHVHVCVSVNLADPFVYILTHTSDTYAPHTPKHTHTHTHTHSSPLPTHTHHALAHNTSPHTCVCAFACANGGFVTVSGTRVLPVTAMVCNFTKPTPTQPSLLTHDETVTLFHEFGHVMHSICSKAAYHELSAFNVENVCVCVIVRPECV